MRRYIPKHAQKKSGHPTQPGNRYTTPEPHHRKRKRSPILHRIVRIFKHSNKDHIVIGLSFIMVIFAYAFILAGGDFSGEAAVVPESANHGKQAQRIEYIKVDIPPEAEQEKRYELTKEERLVLASVVTAEAQAEPFEGKVAVAQCILQACEDDGLRPATVLRKYGYTKNRPDPTTEAFEAVAAVFDFGEVATTEPIKYFYAPALCESEWHESQVYVMTIKGHRFFKEAK